MGPLAELMKHLEVESGRQGDSDRHSKPSMQKDMEVMIDQLRKSNALAPAFKHRKLHAYKQYTPILWKQTLPSLNKWLKRACKESLIF